ncbi:MAG: hypothetical protein DMG57_17110 [Acidobacteria bacterium]|nr:MAG: hypothetical protein DMG57_17110 [Acidobacteriota bacterium]
MSFLLEESEVDGIARAVETSISRGKELLQWWNASNPRFVDLPSHFTGVRMQAFFDNIPLDSRVISGMGCLQTSAFPRGTIKPGASAASLRQWLLDNFIQECCWTGRDAKPGGFSYRPVLLRDGSPPAIRRVEPDLKVRIADIGTPYEWVLFLLDVIDYARALPFNDAIGRFLKRLIKESGYVVYHSFLSHSPRPAPSGAVAQLCFGYAIVPWDARPTILAYGPGRFYAAIKQYRFFVMGDGSVLIEVLFVVTPRTEKILNVGGVDPVYGLTSVLDLLTFRKTGIVEWAHHSIDRYAMGHHGRVHIHMLEGMRSIWEGSDWSIDAPDSDAPRSGS